ncbi:unnamed protein product [Hydatigera taeniaeformis]|uniref:TMF_TATA_bd domain-containing protein n=1 Tax=Hydatigena taeniaeformis TaxID=6205 RepID=A0A0R3X813_HYDTA|nr:unnamed protein product [Hydatigera taeniaeformis]
MHLKFVRRMKNSGRFTALERSLTEYGVDVIVSDATNLGSKKKHHKKRSQKSKAADMPASENSEPIGLTEAVEEGWISVASKKNKAISSQRDIGDGVSAAVPVTPISTIPPTCQPDQPPEAGGSVLFETSIDKSKAPETAAKTPEECVVASSTQSPSAENDLPLETPQLSETGLPQCSSPANQKGNEKVDSFPHAYRSESLVSEALGQGAVIKARSTFPELVFSEAPPTITESSNPERDFRWSDFIQMKATLRAREAECEVLREEVTRLYMLSDGKFKGTPPTTNGSSQKPSPERSKQQQKKQSVLMASKEVQCMIEAPAPPELEPVSSPSSTEAKVILSLQGEIARLAQENTVLTQRQTNLEGRLENAKHQTSKLQSEMRKATSAASKEAEAVVRQQMDEVVKKLQLVIKDKEELLVTKTAQLGASRLAEQTRDKALNNLQNLQAEHTKLMEAKRAEELHLADTMKVLEDIRQERDEAKKEQTLMNQNLNLVRSSMEAEANNLRQRLAHLKASLDQSVHLKEELDSAKSELATTKTAMAEVTAKHEHDVSENMEAQLKAALDQCTHLKEMLASNQNELVTAKMAVTELTEEVYALKAHAGNLVGKNEESLKSENIVEPKSSMLEEGCDECAHLSAEVGRFQEVMASTDCALSNLQHSVGEEEERWRLALQKCCAENIQLKAKLDQLTSRSENDKDVLDSEIECELEQ